MNINEVWIYFGLLNLMIQSNIAAVENVLSKPVHELDGSTLQLESWQDMETGMLLLCNCDLFIYQHLQQSST